MRTITAVLAALLALPALAQTVTSIEPNVGFVYTTTNVSIHGSGFSFTDFDCIETPGLCPVSVVLVVPVLGTPVEIALQPRFVTPTRIDLGIGPRPHGTIAEVKVRIRGDGEVVVKDGFRWDESILPATGNAYHRYLIPVTATNIPGANGSLWTTEWTVRNAWIASFAARVGEGTMIVPFEGVVRPAIDRPAGGEGVYVYVPRAILTPAPMSLRVRDVSRNARSFGASIPIVRDDEYRGGFQFLDVPTDPRYRATLRVYGPDERPLPVGVTIRTDGGFVETRTFETLGVDVEQTDPLAPYPSSLQLDPLTPAARAAGERVHILVGSLISLPGPPPSPSIPIYAFLTITDNETQQVTTVIAEP